MSRYNMFSKKELAEAKKTTTSTEALIALGFNRTTPEEIEKSRCKVKEYLFK